MTSSHPITLRAGLMALLSCLSAPAAVAQSEGDADAGLLLAKRWCVNCHMVDPDQKSASANGAPTFAAVAHMPSTTAMSLRVFLQSQHDRMPDLHLTNTEIGDVTAYILSLKNK